MRIPGPTRCILTIALATSLAACGGDSGDDTAAPGATGAGESPDASDRYPTDSIRWIVPYGAGGSTDLSTRTYATCMEDELGVSIVVENLAGGSGAVGTQELVTAPADGSVLGTVTTGTLVLTPIANDLDYSTDDFTSVAVLNDIPALLFVSKDSPYEDAEAFFAAAKKDPGKLTVGVSGATAPQGIEVRRLKDEYDVNITAVPFEATAETTTALLGNNIDAVLTVTSADVLTQIDSGNFRPIVASPEERLDRFPEVPTFAELGYEELTLSGSYLGLAGPAGLPESVVSTLEDAVKACYEDPAVTEAIGEINMPTEFGGAEGLTEILDRARTVYEPILTN